MNPLDWKREHQIALAIAGLIGATSGCIWGTLITPAHVSFEWGRLWCDYGYSCTYLLRGYWLLIVFWTMLGALISGGIVYTRQLLRD